jgi:hypothetical protein
MTALAMIFAGIGIFGGIALIGSGSKKTTAITFPSEFYKNLKYFKLDNQSVIAIKNDRKLQDEVLFNGTTTSASNYYTQVQKGFEDWLETNDRYDTTNSKITFN